MPIRAGISHALFRRRPHAQQKMGRIKKKNIQTGKFKIEKNDFNQEKNILMPDF